METKNNVSTYTTTHNVQTANTLLHQYIGTQMWVCACVSTQIIMCVTHTLIHKFFLNITLYIDIRIMYVRTGEHKELFQVFIHNLFTCMHRYIHTYTHTIIHTYNHTYIISGSLVATYDFHDNLQSHVLLAW